eukprot:TRINITY_DN21_c0_g1_i1.p2 TRINITY_DN21_c0_g1~~TRINITY_DN21_c0_g1_i1.p2  ORF type:complete len:109 (+),score=20.10 TRINITY_DN21_c0_g1_i1:143-469(+)
MTNLSPPALMAQSATALEEERAASSATRFVTMDRDAVSCARVESLTVLGSQRTATLTMGPEYITQGPAGQATGDHIIGDQTILETNQPRNHEQFWKLEIRLISTSSIY